MVAILDLGSNSFILLVYEKGRAIMEKVYEVGLKSIKDDKQAFRVAKQSLEKIKSEIDGIETYAFGTAIFRERRHLFERLMKYFGLNGMILSEKEEAYLTYLSVDPKRSMNITVFDLGGGSLEVVTKDWFVSLGLGTHVLNSIFDLSLPSAKDFDKAVDYVSKQLPDFDNPVGIGGSFVAIAALKVKKWDLKSLDGFILTFEDIQKISEELRKMNPQQIVNMKIIPPGREKTIVAGCTVAIAIATKGNIKVSTKGFRYTLAEMIEEGKWPISGVPGEI
ncbi:Ppx/GppA phosphatase family protein [Thermotoga profunda]|uniref:Ppx/GppA phosphatase family protein n=1 Tax=Thermotoga profunda TaxID=1508420 RepID=UPI0009E60351|nr:guanosine polyphosphate pyrophosphohydrolase [Thermotoga profunda]